MSIETPIGTIETADIRAVGEMAIAVMASRTRVGRILGEPGTGKTAASLYLAGLSPEPLGARRLLRLCCRRGWSEAALVRRVAETLGAEPRAGQSTDAVLDACESMAHGCLLILDEANHLRWQHLERLRYLSDECGAGLILIGTDLLHRTFIDGRNRDYLAQLARRIGTRQVRMGRMDAKQTAGYVLQPRFGQITRQLAEQFQSHAKGYWGESTELADGCARIIETSGQPFSATVIAAAAKDMAERRGGAA
jgi:DNA transposition AAA+ family ATPase